jgi:hypothetical protein
MGFPAIAGHPGLRELVLEARPQAPGEATLCVFVEGGSQYIQLLMARLGPAATPTLQSLGQFEFIFAARFTAVLDEAVFDGSTLDLRALDGLHAGLTLAGEVSVDRITLNGEVIPWFRAAMSGFAHVNHTPHL